MGSGLVNSVLGYAKKGEQAVSSAKHRAGNAYKLLKTSLDNFKKTNINYNNLVLVKSSKDIMPGSKFF